MSDEAYSSFLDQANQDTSSGKVSVQSQSKNFLTKSVDTNVPSGLQDVQIDFTSDSDEPFEPVSLKWDEPDFPDEGLNAPLRLGKVVPFL